MRTRIVVGLLLVLALVGCDQKAVFEKSIPKEEAKFSKNYLALLQSRDFDAVEAQIDPNLKTSHSRSRLEQIASLLPPEAPTDIQTLGGQTVFGPNGTMVNLTFQYEFSGKWLLANVVLQKKGGDTVVIGIHVQPLPDSLETINRFTFVGKSSGHYAIFALAIIFNLLILGAVVLCIKTRIPKRKWLWMIFILLGFAQLTLNWSDGNVNIHLFSVRVLGAGFLRSGLFAPWLVSVSVPVGAIVFFLKRE